jgi:hypothetical protein
MANSYADAATSANSETFTYTPSHRLASAKGAYGSLASTYDAVGNPSPALEHISINMNNTP